jgi:2-hydroxychromene-2-carboxylate isomerase
MLGACAPPLTALASAREGDCRVSRPPKAEFLFDFGSPNACLAAIVLRQADVKQRLIGLTNDAVHRGVFGSATFFVDAEMFLGKDRLRDVEEATVE